MCFFVFDFDDFSGGYVGGVYIYLVGWDLIGFDVLIFWVKVFKLVNIDEIGFGNDLGEFKYWVVIINVVVNINWKKYYIFIFDVLKLM